MLDTLTYGKFIFLLNLIVIEVPLEDGQATPRIIIPHNKVSVKTKNQHVRNLSHHAAKNESMKHQFKKIDQLNLANYQKIKTGSDHQPESLKRRTNSIQVSIPA